MHPKESKEISFKKKTVFSSYAKMRLKDEKEIIK